MSRQVWRGYSEEFCMMYVCMYVRMYVHNLNLAKKHVEITPRSDFTPITFKELLADKMERDFFGINLTMYMSSVRRTIRGKCPLSL
jgi:hypothetical protein